MPDNNKPFGAEPSIKPAHVELAEAAARHGADAVEQGARAATEALRREALATAESQRRLAHEATQGLADATQRVSQSAQANVEESWRRLSAMPLAAEGGLRDMQQAVANLTAGVMQANVQAIQEMVRLSNPAGIVELQQRFVRQYMDTLMQGTSAIAHAVRRTAEDTRRTLDAKATQSPPSGYRNAAE